MGYVLEHVPLRIVKKKAFVINKFHKRTWDKELGRKRKYYIEEFNPTYNQHQKAYIGTNIPWKAKNSHYSIKN